MLRTCMFLYVIMFCNVLLLDGGSVPLCGAVLVVDVVGSAEVVLPLLPARGQRGQLVRLARTAHILTLQELPTGLRNKTSTSELHSTRHRKHDERQLDTSVTFIRTYSAYIIYCTNEIP